MRALRVVRHPLWTAGTVARGLAAAPVPATARRALDHLVRPRLAAAPVGTDAALVRRARRVRRHSLDSARSTSGIACARRCSVTRRPDSSTSVKAPAGSSLRLRLRALAAGLARRIRRRSTSRIDVDVPGIDVATTTQRCRSIPARSWTDRRWHTVSIPLPPTAEPALDLHCLALDARRAPAPASATPGRSSASRASSGGAPRGGSAARSETFARRIAHRRPSQLARAAAHVGHRRARR